MKINNHVIKHVIAPACITSLLLPTQFAHADSALNFVGELDTYLSYNRPAGDEDVESKTGIESNGLTTSYVGIHGSHDLDNGLTAIGSVEAFLRPDSGEIGRFEGDMMFARAANFGLKGDFGQFTIGRNASLYFLSTIIFNPFGDSFSFSPMVLMSFGGGGLYGDSGWSDSVVYTTPTAGGFTSSIAYAFGEKAGDNSTNKIAANTFFKSGDFGFTAAVQKISGTQTGATGLGPDDDQTDALLGVSYAMGDNTFYAQYQMMRDKLDSEVGDIDRDTLVLSASIAVGKGAIYLGYGLTQVDTPYGDYDRNIYTLMYNLPLSKKLDFYAGYTNDDPEWTEKTGQTVGLGGRFRF
ncbi:MAG: porin [Gammaproteobacteria bacterium]|nr:MAG: porin [Gammaproteobacteria bacterium]